MYAEEQFLRKKFGDQYLKWAALTPAFIPAFRKWIKPENTLNWKAVLKNESTCLLSLCLMFFLFEIIEKTLEGQLSHISYTWTFYAMLAAVVTYGFIKVMFKVRKST